MIEVDRKPWSDPAVAAPTQFLLVAVLLVFSLGTSCTSELPEEQQSSEQSGVVSIDPSQHYEASENWEEIASNHEDPDPLVNPTDMFRPAPDDSSKIASDSTLKLALDANPLSLNPLFASSTYEFQLSAMMFDGPFTFNARMEWRVNAAMVERCDISNEGRTYTLKLKKGLKWHDGEPFTAHDIVFSWEQYWDENVEIPAGRDTTKKVTKCIAIDDHTVELTNENVSPVNRWNVYFSLIPKHIYNKEKDSSPDLKSSDYYIERNRSPVGNGPYKFVKWLANDRIELERWEGYSGKKPHYKKVILKIIQDDNIKLLRFETEEIDNVRMIEKQFALQSGPDTPFAKVGNKLRSSQWAYRYLGFNMDGSNPFFADRRVRRAMSHAFDRDRIIRQLTFSLAQSCHGIFHPQSKHFDPSTKLVKFDLDEAERLLDEAGWKVDEEGGGWRYKDIDGSKVKFSFTLDVPLGNDFYPNYAAIFQEDLKSVGVDLQLRVVEFASLVAKTRKHDFQAFSMAWGTGVDPDTLYNVWHSSSHGSSGRNYGKYKNARVDELLDKGRVEMDQEKRTEYYREMGKLIYDDQPYIFIANPPLLFGLNKKIQGITVGPRGLFGFEPSWRGWWSPVEAK